MTFDLKAQGLLETKRWMRLTRREARNQLGRKMPRAARILRDEWRKRWSGTGGRRTLQRRTGRSAASIRVRRESQLRYSVGSPLPHFRIHEYGGTTSPHLIFPRRARLLAFFWEKIGKDIALPFVRHPGSRIPERPHFRPALRASRSRIGKTLHGAVDRGIEVAGRRAGVRFRKSVGGGRGAFRGVGLRGGR